MKEETAPLKTNDYGLQEYLSLGYIYLVILGILTDVIYYISGNIKEIRTIR